MRCLNDVQFQMVFADPTAEKERIMQPISCRTVSTATAAKHLMPKCAPAWTTPAAADFSAAKRTPNITEASQSLSSGMGCEMQVTANLYKTLGELVMESG
jgi:hypothetical protein